MPERVVFSLLTIKGYLEQMKKKSMAFAMCGISGHSIYAATVPGMYHYLPYPAHLGVQHFLQFTLTVDSRKNAIFFKNRFLCGGRPSKTVSRQGFLHELNLSALESHYDVGN